MIFDEKQIFSITHINEVSTVVRISTDIKLPIFSKLKLVNMEITITKTMNILNHYWNGGVEVTFYNYYFLVKYEFLMIYFDCLTFSDFLVSRIGVKTQNRGRAPKEG